MPTITQALILIAILSLGTAITRFLPFVFFPNAESAPPYVHYLGKMLPTAAISLLVVYCFREIELTAAPHGLPEVIAIAAVAALHIWKKNTLLSIAAGTVVYMGLVQFVF
ncbi:MAG: AzlD domain-containing protein [Defluviitaleaceae bacterium]|nr:AzlD domain-containing protein [Defluviitaleaceae bacterium]MCL2262071.1 AzlD domain-containing protein [Defluviitaleaceae bacterium]